MRKKYEVNVKGSFEREYTVFATSSSAAMAEAESKMDDEFGDEIYDFESKAECPYDGDDWGWGAQEQWDMDRQYFGAEEQASYGDQAYFLGERDGHLMVFWESWRGDLKVVAFNGSRSDIKDGFFARLFEQDEDYKSLDDFYELFEYDDIEWDEDESAGLGAYEYSATAVQEHDDTMASWLNGLELRPLSEWIPNDEPSQEEIKRVENMLRRMYESQFYACPEFETFDKMIDRAVTFVLDNRETDWSFEDGCLREMTDYIKFGNLYHSLSELKQGDVIRFNVKENGECNWHMGIVRNVEDLDKMELHFEDKCSLNVREADHQTELDMWNSYKVGMLNKIEVLVPKVDTESLEKRVKELEYVINNIKSCL